MIHNNEAVELTTFQLNDCSLQQFTDANEEGDAFLKRQTGCRLRKIFELPGGTVADMLLWDDVESGTNAMHKLMTELSESKVRGMIDQSTVSWNISPVKHSVNL